jgi:hypothetical protein
MVEKTRDDFSDAQNEVESEFGKNCEYAGRKMSLDKEACDLWKATYNATVDPALRKDGCASWKDKKVHDYVVEQVCKIARLAACLTYHGSNTVAVVGKDALKAACDCVIRYEQKHTCAHASVSKKPGQELTFRGMYCETYKYNKGE